VGCLRRAALVTADGLLADAPYTDVRLLTAAFVYALVSGELREEREDSRLLLRSHDELVRVLTLARVDADRVAELDPQMLDGVLHHGTRSLGEKHEAREAHVVRELELARACVLAHRHRTAIELARDVFYVDDGPTSRKEAFLPLLPRAVWARFAWVIIRCRTVDSGRKIFLPM